jgi:hypothetical protein
MRKFTPQEDQFLLDNYLIMPAKRMSVKLGRTESTARQRMKILKIIVPKEVIAKFKIDSQFKKGITPFNKGKKQAEFMSAAGIERSRATTFKTGHMPHNAYHKNGAITTRQDNHTGIKYKYIKLSRKKWRELHRHIYEKKYGKIPKGMVLIFKDGNQMNCTLRNLKLITRQENMQRNTIHRYPPILKSTIRIVSKLNKKIKQHEKQN